MLTSYHTQLSLPLLLLVCCGDGAGKKLVLCCSAAAAVALLFKKACMMLAAVGAGAYRQQSISTYFLHPHVASLWLVGNECQPVHV